MYRPVVRVTYFACLVYSNVSHDLSPFDGCTIADALLMVLGLSSQIAGG
jgi:hypothetical protein